MSKYVKVMFGTNSGAKRSYKYKIGEVNVCDNWNPSASSGRDFGGFNYTSEDSILRWLHRGDTIYDVEVPDDAEVIKIEGATTLYRTNKIIVSNPRKITDDMALEFYRISNIPDNAYYKALAVVSLMDYKNTAIAVFNDRVNLDNIDKFISEWEDFVNHKGNDDRKNYTDTMNVIWGYLNEVKSNLLISVNVDKDPYIKELTKDKVINLTGQSGSGKSYYAKENFSDDRYLIVDTDDVFLEDRFKNSYGINKELGEYFRDKYKILPDLCNDFDLIYDEIISYTKKYNKIIVIDCAQFHCIRDISRLRGRMVIIRTSINTCYNRCINRWKDNNKNYNIDELDNYSMKKKKIYDWYKETNRFILDIDKL